MSGIEPEEARNEPAAPARRGPARRHPSLEKTDCIPASAFDSGPPPREDVSTPPLEASHDGRVSDTDLLREELEQKMRECVALCRTVEELKTQTQALRSDFSVQRDEYLLEIRTLNELIRKAQEEAASLQFEMADLKQSNKHLKAQNLSLQYILNSWGIPVCSGEESAIEMEGSCQEGLFFPALTPVTPGEDPVPVGLRGDLGVVPFPDLLLFLANSNFEGVLTVVTDGIVSKLYIEKAALRLVGWNSRDPELGLLALLEESQIVPSAALEEYRALGLYDLELASFLVTEKQIPTDTIRAGLREHARVILGYLFQSRRGLFFFQPGRILRKRDLHFQLLATDVLLKTAAEVDEKYRDNSLPT